MEINQIDFDIKLLTNLPYFDLNKSGEELGFDIEENVNNNFSEIANTIVDNYTKIRKGYIIRDLKMFRLGVHTMKGFFR